MHAKKELITVEKYSAFGGIKICSNIKNKKIVVKRSTPNCKRVVLYYLLYVLMLYLHPEYLSHVLKSNFKFFCGKNVCDMCAKNPTF